MYYTPQWFKRMERWLGDSSLQPLVNLVQHHETSYRDIQQFIEKPPGKLRGYSKFIHRSHYIVSRLAVGFRRCVKTINLGVYAVVISLATVGKLLTEKRRLPAIWCQW